MRMTHLFVIATVLGAFPTLTIAQKPKNTGKVSYSHAAGKGTPATLSHHKDNSGLALRGNNHSGPAADLNRIEQQSLHSQVASPKKARVRTAVAPKIGADHGNKSTPINFSGHAPAHNLATTKSIGKTPGATPAKPH